MTTTTPTTSTPTLTLEEVRQRLIDAMALSPAERDGWLDLAEARLYALRVRDNPFTRMFDVSTFTGRMRTARECLGLSQKQAAIRARVSPPTYSKYESGKRDIPAPRFATICRVLAVREAWMLGLSEEGGPRVPERQLRKRVTKYWRERQDVLARRVRARKEAARLNARYRLERLRAAAAEG